MGCRRQKKLCWGAGAGNNGIYERPRPRKCDHDVLRPLTLARRLAAYAEQTQRSRSAIMRLALDAFLRERCPFIFHRDGKPVNQFAKSWETACTAAGARGLRFHDLRRTAIRNMVRAGVSQHVAMRISGHQTDAIFRRYDITSDEDLRLAAERTAAYTDQLPTTPTVRQLSESDAGRRHRTPQLATKSA